MPLSPLPADLLQSVSPDVRAELEAYWHTRPCVQICSERTSDLPLHRGWFGRILNRPTASPTLPATVSKAGGMPYAEEALDWTVYRFLLQIDLADVHAAGPTVDGLPATGLFAIDFIGELDSVGSFRIRFYGEPSDTKAVPQPDAKSHGAYEAMLRCHSAISEPSPYRLLKNVSPDVADTHIDALTERWNPWSTDDVVIGGHLNDAWAEGVQLAQVGCLKAAGIAWGSNHQLLTISAEELVRGDLAKAEIHTVN